MDRDYGIHPFRAAGSAGGRFPLELYVAVPPGGPLPAGVHWYDPLEHALVQVGPPPCGGGPAIVVTGIPWRTGWRYRERGYRHVYWDAWDNACRSRRRSPTRPAWRPGCTPASPMRRWPSWPARTGCTSSRWRWCRWVRHRPPFVRKARRPRARWTALRWSSRS